MSEVDNNIKKEIYEKTHEFSKKSSLKKKEIINALTGVLDEDAAKIIGHETKVKFAKNFRNKNKELIDEYKSIRRGTENIEYDENSLKTESVNLLKKSLRLLRESNSLKRLKSEGSSHFDKSFNGKVDKDGYLFDENGQQTNFLGSQIDSGQGMTGIEDQESAKEELKKIIKDI